MALSISQAQAEFLRSTGFQGGTDRGDVAQLSGLQKLLSEYIVTFLSKAEEKLNAADAVSTGDLLSSLGYKITATKRGYRIDFSALEYYKFVDKGVRGKGASSRNSTSPYKFQFITPSKKHKEAIEGWLNRNSSIANSMDVSRYGAMGRERRAMNPAQKVKTLAFLIARKMKREGLKATNFWTEAFDETFADFGQKVSEEIGKTVTINLQQMAADLRSGRGTIIPR